jgi:hypothetical protein
MRKSSDIE